MMLRRFVETPRSVNVERVLQDYFSVEQSSDIPAEPLAELLTRIGLDEKGIAAIRTELLSRNHVARAASPPVKSPWFEIAASVLHQKHGFGCVVFGSEALAVNDGKVLVQFDDYCGNDQGPRLFVDPAELKLTRVWHPKHGPGRFLDKEADGEVIVFFDDKDGSSHINAVELSPCVVLGKEFMSNSDCKVAWHPELGLGVIVGEEENGKLIVVFDKNDGSARVNPAEPSTSASLPAKSMAEIKAPDPAIASALGQVDRPFTPGAIADETPMPAPPSPTASMLGVQIWDQKYGLGRVGVAQESGDNGVAVWFDDCQMEVFFDPADLKRTSVSHPEHGRGVVMALAGDGEPIVHFANGKRRVDATELRTTNLRGVVSDAPKLGPAADTASEHDIASALGQVPFTPGAIAAEAPKLSVKDTLLQYADGRMTIPVDMVFAMRDLFA
jgi:hypothetical protein